MADSSDNDDLPDLVESSDEDSPTEKKPKKNIDLASGWLKKGTKFLEKQDLWMRIFSLCPFLFGINNMVSAAWMKALFSAKLLLKENRQYELTYLEWQEWECVDLMDHIIPIVQNKLRKLDVLFRCLDCVDVLEDCKTGVIIDVDLAIQAAKKYDEVLDLWTAVLKEKVCDGKETAARFGVLYVIKLYHCHVISIEQHQTDFVDEKKKEYKNSNSSKKAEEFKKEGNYFYGIAHYKESVGCYTSALKVDPLHHIYFGNRAQAYNKLKEFKEALADGRRAVTLKPEFAKGHYRYSQAFYELGQLESAIKVNKLGLQLCEKVKNSDFNSVKELEEQGVRFRQEREKGAHHQHPLTSIPKDLEKKLESIPGAKGDLNKKFGVEEPPHLVSTSSDSDSDSSQTQDSKRKRKKGKSKGQEEKKTSQKDHRRSKDMTENLNMPETQFIELTEEAKRKIKQAKLQEDKLEMKSLMAEGSEALLKNVNKAAVVSYKKALELTLHVADINDLGLDNADVLTLKYAFGMAAVSTGVHKNILEGMEKFKEILEVNVRYPMAYYGLGKAYVTMNRFIQALQKLQEGYTIIEKDNKSFRINQNREFWPGTRTVIEESDPKCLKKLLEDLIQICHFPPTPDGVCRHHTDSTDSRTDIYRSDLDFKGLYQIFCQMGCIVSFHPNCWKDYKMEYNKTIDKDMLDTECVTPDCSGLIIKILIERDLTKKELISEKHTSKNKHAKDKKPVVKMKSTSDHKLAKKNDKKDLRKQRRRERLEEKDDLAEDGDKPPRGHLHVPEVVEMNDVEGDAMFDEEKNDVQPLPDVRETVMLKKDEINISQASGKQKKSKKKKDKSKQLLSVEVNFLDRKELLGESSALSDEEKKDATTAKPVKTPLLPTPQASHDVKKQVKNGKKISTLSDQEPNVDEITQNLFSFFTDILTVHGPLAIDDSRIQQELEVLPLEAQEKIKAAGGLGDFFRQDFKFAVIDDVISLMTDAVKARDIALKRRDERVNQGKLPQAQDTWKTVGKGNTVDSLRESVTNIPTNNGKSSYVSVASNAQNKSSISSAAVTPSKVTGHSTLAPDIVAGNTACLSNSNSSNSLSSTDSSTVPIKHLSEKSKFKHSDPSTDPSEQFPRKDSGIDALDTIDDINVPMNPLENEMKSTFDDLDDFDIRSDTKSPVVDKEKTSKRQKKGKAKLEIKIPSDGKTYPYISDSSSDISEASDISLETPKFVVGGTPRPLKPLNRFGQGVPSEIKTDLENDITDNHSPVNTLENELKRLADDYIKKTDEKFMSELADSVVDKICSGKSVTDMERATTLQQVSADIRKDFEKSVRSGSLTGSGIWADTPASADYSKNMGKFANDFMKKHYQKDNILVSPTSDPSLLYSKKSSSPTDFGVSDSNFRINSPFNMTSSESDTATRTGFSSVVSSSASTYTSGYTLFSGPSLGLDSLSAVKPTSPNFPTPSQPFIRPPASATSYYQTVPPPGPIGSQPRPPIAPLRMPAFHTVLKIDKETQVVSVECTSVETMTDPQNMVELEAYLHLKDDLERRLRETTLLKDKISAEYQKLEQKYKEEHSQLLNLQKILEVEKKKWLKEKESLQVEMKNLGEQLAVKQKTEMELTLKITAEQNKVKEITQRSNEQRAKDALEIRKYNEDAELQKRNREEQCERAKNAEIDILKLKLAAATKMLVRSQKEAAYHIHNLEGFVKKHEEDSKPVPVQLKQSLDHWKSVAEKCEEALEKVKVDYESQIEAVSDGKLMSELSPITIPSPPPIPDAIKAMMMPNSMPVKMPLPIPSMMPRNPIPFGPRHPPPSNINTGTAARFPAPNTMAQVRPEYNVSTTTTAQRPPQAPAIATPRPLQAAAGMVPPRPPLLGVRPPLAPPSKPVGRAPAGPQAPKTSFEKLILKLQMDFPNHTKSDFNQFIQALRQSRGGSLSGMSMQDIITEVSEMIAEKDRQASAVKTAQASNPAGTSIGPPPGISSSWAFPTSNGTSNGSSGVGEMFQEDEDPCAICHEELTEGCAITLECAHKFHDECIRKWFREQSTCPNCRVHSLLSDDFPSLA